MRLCQSASEAAPFGRGRRGLGSRRFPLGLPETEWSHTLLWASLLYLRASEGRAPGFIDSVVHVLIVVKKWFMVDCRKKIKLCSRLKA